MKIIAPLSTRSMRTLSLSIILGTSVGCSSVKAPRFETLGVRESSPSISSTSTDRTTYEFIVRATNPNRDPIPLRDIDYTVTLDNTHTFSAIRSPETTLHTFGEHTFTLPAVFNISPHQLNGTLDYTITGSAKYLKPGKLAEVLFDSDIKVPEATFTLEGKVNIE